MIPLFRSGSKLASASAFAIAAFSLLSCGGSGSGEDEGWAPNSPVGHFFRIDTTQGTSTGTNPGVIQLNFTGDSQATIFASSVFSQDFNVSGLANYIKTGKNSFTIAFDSKKSPTAPSTRTAVFEAKCVLDAYDDNTKYTTGVVEWTYEGFGILGVSHYETGKGSGATMESALGASPLQ